MQFARKTNVRILAFSHILGKDTPKTDIIFFNTITISLSRRFVFSNMKEKLT